MGDAQLSGVIMTGVLQIGSSNSRIRFFVSIFLRSFCNAFDSTAWISVLIHTSLSSRALVLYRQVLYLSGAPSNLAIWLTPRRSTMGSLRSFSMTIRMEVAMSQMEKVSVRTGAALLSLSPPLLPSSSSASSGTGSFAPTILLTASWSAISCDRMSVSCCSTAVDPSGGGSGLVACVG